MTPWRWWAGVVGAECYCLASDCATREEAIREAAGHLELGDQLQIIEARSSEAARYEGADFVPFLRTRNHEIINANPEDRS